MKYFGGCDVGSTYTKCVILDENGKMVAHTTIRSKINSEASATLAMEETVAQVPDIITICQHPVHKVSGALWTARWSWAKPRNRH